MLGRVALTALLLNYANWGVRTFVAYGVGSAMRGKVVEGTHFTWDHSRYDYNRISEGTYALIYAYELATLGFFVVSWIPIAIVAWRRSQKNARDRARHRSSH